MKMVLKIVFIVLYVLFVLVGLVYQTPQDVYALFALLVIPALGFWMMYKTNLKGFEKFVASFRDKSGR